MISKNNDLSIFYYGGSGGFYLLHQLLYTGNFFCVFDDDWQEQFKNIDTRNWKGTESWPDNKKTLITDTKLRKIYFTCNNPDSKRWVDFPGNKVILYTDLKSHMRLVLFKKAFCYNETGIFSIKNKVKEFYKFNPFLKIKKIQKICKIPETHMIYYQDILTVDGLTRVLENLGCKINQNNIDFLNHYISLHPPKLLKKIGIEI